MAERWEYYLGRWTSAKLIEPSTAERIRAYEGEQEKTQGLRWPVLLAIGLGGLLMGAGVLLFVAAHWDTLSPAERFGLVLLLVALFHVAAALVVERFSALSTALHAVGTICLGAGIFLAGQIFNLQEHWPGGVMLWALGAWVAWALLRDWPQAALAALLTPMWLSGEWVEATRGWIGGEKILAEGLLLLSITYLTALLPEKETPVRNALAWIGGLALMALVVWPGARAVLGPGPQLAELFRQLQRRFDPWAWLSLAVLIATGLTQMTANKNYNGFLLVTNPWTVAILTKHFAVGAMMLVAGYMQWGLQPALARIALLEARGLSAPDAERLRRRELTLTRLNLLCGLLVLALTAIARTL